MSARAGTGWVRKIIAGVGAVALAGVGLTAIAPTSAMAADPAPADVVTTDALPTWQINGVVYSQAIVGDTVYVTGSFTSARPPGRGGRRRGRGRREQHLRVQPHHR